ncbi:MAG TPA: PAS domain S-box protein [Opitutus sp.]|nr:PAS domain S-box protein [Opitutus sp.]
MSIALPLPALVLIPALAFGAGAFVVYWFFRRERRGFVLELRSLWERLDAIFYRSPLAVSLCAPDAKKGELRVIDCNDRACALHGLSREALLGSAARPFGGDEAEAARVRQWLRAPRPVELWRGERTLRHPDGTEVPIAYEWARVEIGDRELVLALERDISEQRRAEAALKHSEQRFRKIVETADCLLWNAHVREAEGKLQWKFDVPTSGLKQRLEAAAGLSFSDGMVWSRLKIPDLPAMNERSRTALREGWPSYSQEFRVLLPGGVLLWLQESTEIARLGPNEWNLVGVIVDVTRLKETETAMRVSEERNRLVLAASNDGIWDYDVAAGRMICSERCCAMLGLSAADMPQTADGWRTRIHPEDLVVEEAAWKKYRGSGEPCVYQVRFRHRDGSWRWFMVRAIAVKDEAGALKRVIGSHTDITELKRTDSELQQGRRLRAIGELVGGIAHEFNNLLTPMLLQTTMMRDGHAPGGTLSEQLKPVIEAITEARELTQRILTFGRRTAVNVETLDLAAVVHDNLELLRHTIDRRVRLHLAATAAPLWIAQNRTDVAQIVINLVLNARDTLLEKAAGRPPENWEPAIEIEFNTLTANEVPVAEEPTAGAVRRWHALIVRDNGMGMVDEVKERIFEPFYTTKEVGHGTGLGLATVWHLIKTMGGVVDVDSRPGFGSTFRVLFPATEAPAHAAVAPRPAPAQKRQPAGAGARILLADDQREVAATLSRILQHWGHRVVVVADGTAALRQLTERPGEFDVCITDLNMPGASGTEIVRAIRERQLPLKVVVIGGYLTAGVRQTLEGMDIDAIVPKPFTLDDVIAAMRACGW